MLYNTGWAGAIQFIIIIIIIIIIIKIYLFIYLGAVYPFPNAKDVNLLP